MENWRIDIAIVKNVFNWIEETVGPDVNGDFGGTAILVESTEWYERTYDYLPRKGSIPLNYFVKKYSRDFNLAMSALKEIAKKGWKYSVVFSNDSYSVAILRQEWITSDLYQARAIPSWETDQYHDLPRIICLAALEAVEIDKKEAQNAG